ncbi:hypothetical protein GH733_002873, partial [Mirounga leonina]
MWSSANPDPNCCLGVFGLSLYTTERDLREVFSKYGPIADVSIVYDQQSRRVYNNLMYLSKAKERANGMELDGLAAHAVGITMTEDMIEAMMIETTTADHTEEEVEEEEDGELLKTGIRFT